VVLVDVFTFECINCVRVTPNLKRLYGSYPRSEFEIIAVHTPEVPSYQRRMSYVAAQAQSAQLPWPIALDNDHRIWDAYGVSGWPTQLVFDRGGRLRNTIVGDSQDDDLNNAIKVLLRG
jgi:thiol-disulfide isomerase/thioredoxin